MLATDDDKQVTKQNARFVHADIARRNKENADNFANEQKALSNEFWCEVTYAYENQTYRNYRKNAIIIKVEKPSGAVKRSKAVFDLNEKAQELGIKIKELHGHVFYEFAL